MATKLNKNWFQKLFKLPGKMDCKICEPHAHKYVSASGLSTYRNSEKEYIDDLYWTKDAVELSQDIVDMTDYDLFITKDNIEYIREAIEKNKPYVEYEYSYEEPNFAMGIALGMALGFSLNIPVGIIWAMVYSYIFSDTEYDWTSNKNHSNLTGKIRDVNFKYHGYDVGINKKGERVLIKGLLPEDIVSINKSCPYFKADDFYVHEYSKPYKKVKTK